LFPRNLPWPTHWKGHDGISKPGHTGFAFPVRTSNIEAGLFGDQESPERLSPGFPKPEWNPVPGHFYYCPGFDFPKPNLPFFRDRKPDRGLVGQRYARGRSILKEKRNESQEGQWGFTFSPGPGSIHKLKRGVLLR